MKDNLKLIIQNQHTKQSQSTKQKDVLPFEWTKHYTNNGKICYKNHVTGTTHWHLPIPPGYSKLHTADGTGYYQNDKTKSTHWEIPKSEYKTQPVQRIEDLLPFKWTKNYTHNGKLYYQDHINKKTHWSLPKLFVA
eukprot:102542_1